MLKVIVNSITFFIISKQTEYNKKLMSLITNVFEPDNENDKIDAV